MNVPPISDAGAKTTNKYPLAVMVGILCAFLGSVATAFLTTTEDRNDDCKEQQKYLRDRIAVLEAREGETIEKYTATIMYKDAQIKNRENTIDSLKTKVQ